MATIPEEAQIEVRIETLAWQQKRHLEQPTECCPILTIPSLVTANRRLYHRTQAS